MKARAAVSHQVSWTHSGCRKEALVHKLKRSQEGPESQMALTLQSFVVTSFLTFK